MAVLLSARVISEFFEEVVIVEKEMHPDKSRPRRSVPQSSQGHVLSKRGEEILEELFPGIMEEMVKDGSIPSDFAGNITWFHHGSQKIKYESDVSIVQQSRPFLEWHVNLLVIGDAICRIDPAFAQGMSIAAMEAMTLRELLSKSSDRKKLTFNYYRKLNRINETPWLIALTEDYRFLSTVGKKPAGLPLLQWSVKKVVQACSHIKRVYRHFMDVLHLKAHPVSLLKPSILIDVLIKNKTP